MKLLTKEIVKKLKKSTYDIIHDKIPNVPIIVKYFSLTGWTWYVYAGDQFQNNETNKILIGAGLKAKRTAPLQTYLKNEAPIVLSIKLKIYTLFIIRNPILPRKIWNVFR